MAVSVCPHCGHHVTISATPYISQTAAQLNEHMEKAVEIRIGRSDSQEEYKVLHRRLRGWLANELRKQIGIKWREVTAEQLPDAIKYCEAWHVLGG